MIWLVACIMVAFIMVALIVAVYMITHDKEG